MQEIATIKVGSKTVKISRITTGAEIRAAGGYGSEGTLYRVVPGKKTPNEVIGDNQEIEVKNGDHFIVVIPAVGGNGEGLEGLPPALQEDVATLREIYGRVTVNPCPPEISNHDAFYLIKIHSYPIPQGKGWNMNGQHGSWAGENSLNGVPHIRYCWNPSPGTEQSLAAKSSVSFAEMIAQRFEKGLGQ